MQILDETTAGQIEREDGVRPGLVPHVLPLHATDQEIEAAVQEARLLPLLMSVVHVTGDLAILQAAGRTQRPSHSTDTSGGIAPELQASHSCTSANYTCANGVAAASIALAHKR